MGRQARIGILVVSVLLVLIGGYAARASEEAKPPARSVMTPASVTAPEPRDAVVVEPALSPNNRGWQPPGQDPVSLANSVRSELMDAYSLAVALAPDRCHLSSSLLAAIGQVESGNLAGHRIDAKHRVTPAMLGPVLDGGKYAAIPDTDDGKWDGHRKWDRALGPMQLLPATWRVVGLDLDEDGVRDPQNIYDAAGAAMVYLCDADRDLATQDGLVEAVLAYNHSRAYLRQVLAWKTVFDGADLLGHAYQPAFGAWAATPEPFVADTPATDSASAKGAASEHVAVAAGRPARTASTTAHPKGSTTPAGNAATRAPGKDADEGDTGKVPSQEPGKEPSKEPGKTPATGPGDGAGPAPGKDPGSDPSSDPGTGVVTSPADPATCVAAEPSPASSGSPLDPAEATDLLAEGTPVCCVAPDGSATLLTPTPSPTAAATDPVDGTLPEACVGASVVPVPTATPTP